jgi:hypothetical protein
MTGMRNKNKYITFLLLLLALGMLSACGDTDSEGIEEAGPVATLTATELPMDTPAPPPTSAPTPSPPPTPTPQPAALVNGQPILLEEYEQELARYELAQAELGLVPDPAENDSYAVVLDALIERELIRQAAVVQGITIAPETVELKINELREAASEYGSLDDWLAANLYSEEEFQDALTAELVVEQMVAIVTADVPAAMEHVHVRYIQVDNLELAQSLYGQIYEGGDFAQLAQKYSLDQLTAPYGGDLGYFARGSLLVPEIEEVAFNLQLEEVSDIISVTNPDSGQTTYYIVELLERIPNRMLGADLRHRLLQEAFDGWLEEQIKGATIINFLENEK